MTQKDDKKYLFEAMPIPRAVLKLAVPVVISSLVTIIYNLADTFFVGMLNDPVQNAAVTLVYPVMLAFNAVNNLFGVGTSSMMSRSLGRGDHEKVRSASAFGFYGALFSGLLFSLLCTVFRMPLLDLLGAQPNTLRAASDYMLWTVCVGAMPSILNVVQSYMVRSEGAALHASIGTMSGCILNIILDPIFILPWGLDMGAAGAGLATFVSNCGACLYFLILARVKKGNTYVCMDIRRLRKPSAEVVLGILGVGIPSSIQNLLNVLGSAVLNNFTAVFGASAVAAMGISHKINMVPMQVVLGFAQGVMPLIGYNYASGDHRRMKTSINFALGIIVPIMLAVTVIYRVSAEDLIRLFIANEEIIGYGAAFLQGMCLCMTFICVDFMVVGVFQSLGMGKFALLFACVRKAVLEIPLLFLLNRLYPLYGLPYAQPGAEIIMALLSVFMLCWIYRKKCNLQK